MAKKKSAAAPAGIAKCPTGISGFDQITSGGLPRGRPTLVCGNAGCGKTLFGLEFLIRGATRFGEPGVFISFEESSRELTENTASLGWDLKALVARKKIALDHVYIEPSEIEEAGHFNLDGLFIRIDAAMKAVKAKRIVIDTLEVLFGGFSDPSLLRAEIRRLFRWLKEKGVTAVVTGEQGDGTLTRHGLEEYVSDCVIFLDHRMADQVAVRRMRVVKYRGSAHGTNEFPFLIDGNGFSVLPITSLGLEYPVSRRRISSGIKRLDKMLGGRGFYRGSSVLVSGTAGTGKTSLAASFVDAACRRGEKAIYFSFEESPAQIMRNMNSIGIDLKPWVDSDLLMFRSVRVTSSGLEAHLSMVINAILGFGPKVVVVDPVSTFDSVGSQTDAKAVLTRLTDFMKNEGITSYFTGLTRAGSSRETTETEISSLMDSWILLRDIELNGERNRGIYILKSRGMDHSNQIREFLLTDDGVDLVDVYVGPGGVLTGTTRVAQEAREKAESNDRGRRIDAVERELASKHHNLASEIAALKQRYAQEIEDLENELSQHRTDRNLLMAERKRMGKMRGLDT